LGVKKRISYISWCFGGFYVEKKIGDGLLPDFGSYRGKGWMNNCEVLGNANDVFFCFQIVVQASNSCKSHVVLQQPLGKLKV